MLAASVSTVYPKLFNTVWLKIEVHRQSACGKNLNAIPVPSNIYWSKLSKLLQKSLLDIILYCTGQNGT